MKSEVNHYPSVVQFNIRGTHNKPIELRMAFDKTRKILYLNQEDNNTTHRLMIPFDKDCQIGLEKFAKDILRN